MPLPMPNPLCAAIGYFFVMDGEITPLVPLAPVERVIEFTKNSNFGRADDDFEELLREVIDRVYARPDGPALEGTIGTARCRTSQKARAGRAGHGRLVCLATLLCGDVSAAAIR